MLRSDALQSFVTWDKTGQVTNLGYLDNSHMFDDFSSIISKILTFIEDFTLREKYFVLRRSLSSKQELPV